MNRSINQSNKHYCVNRLKNSSSVQVPFLCHQTSWRGKKLHWCEKQQKRIDRCGENRTWNQRVRRLCAKTANDRFRSKPSLNASKAVETRGCEPPPLASPFSPVVVAAASASDSVVVWATAAVASSSTEEEEAATVAGAADSTLSSSATAPTLSLSPAASSLPSPFAAVFSVGVIRDNIWCKKKFCYVPGKKEITWRDNKIGRKANKGDPHFAKATLFLYQNFLIFFILQNFIVFHYN